MSSWSNNINTQRQKQENTGTCMESNFAVGYSVHAKYEAQSSTVQSPWLNGKYMPTDE